jgi:hypothetical protein
MVMKRKWALIGAAVGASIAIVLIPLTLVNPFYRADGVIELLTFRMCPLFILGFANGVGSMASLVFLAIVGNAILYGCVFGVAAFIISFFNRTAA